MKIESQVFGSIDIPDEKVIEFPAGLPGFEACKNFALVHEQDSTSSLFLLQSLDNPEAVFSITAPDSLGVNYEFSLSDAETAQLKLANPADAFVAVIVRKEEGAAGSPVTAGMRANFMAPLVINVAERRGLQKIITRLGCDVTLRAEG